MLASLLTLMQHVIQDFILQSLQITGVVKQLCKSGVGTFLCLGETR